MKMSEAYEAVAVFLTNISNILMKDSDSEYSDDEEIFLLYMKESPQKRVRISNYLENVVHLYSDAHFKTHFRMKRQTFYAVLRLLGPMLTKRVNRDKQQGRHTIDPEKQLLITIWCLGTPDSYRSITDRFDVGKASGLRSVRRVVKALLKFKSDFIKWPTTEECHNIMGAFENRFRFPDVVGCVDGTHIKIAAPKEKAADYINRKGYHSIQLQVTCDNRKKFIHCYVGHPGSTHDQRVFRNSGLKEICSDNTNFPNNGHLLGDAAYSLLPHLMVPYRDNGRLTNRQRNFNWRLSQTRMTVEHAIGLLKGRFRSLLDRLDVKRTDLIPFYVMACCILHNICLNLNDDFDIPVIINDIPVVGANQNERANREALLKRDEIADLLPLN